VTGHAIGAGMVTILRRAKTGQYTTNLPKSLHLVAPKTYGTGLTKWTSSLQVYAMLHYGPAMCLDGRDEPQRQCP
jgi:hypothetical protein